MGFLRNLFRGKPKPAAQPDPSAHDAKPAKPAEPRTVQKSAMATGSAEDSIGGAGNGGVNIWDFDTGEEETPPVAKPATAKAARGRRNKTRIIGFESSNNDVVSLFEQNNEAPAIAPSKSIAKPNMGLSDDELPVGWLIVVDGCGRGRSFTLTQGVNTLGSATGRTVKLSFGDIEIAQHHAKITYSLDGYRLEHGETQAAISLNGDEIQDAVELSDGDHIRVGETELRFVALCGDAFDWSSTETKGASNAASA